METDKAKIQMTSPKDKMDRFERITRSILLSIKEADASNAGGVRTEAVRKIIMDNIKNEVRK